MHRVPVVACHASRTRSRVFSVETFRANRRLQFAAGSSFKQRQEPKYHLRSAAVNNPRNKDPSRPRKRLTEREVGALHEALLHAVSHRHPCRAVQRKHLPLLPRDVAVDEEMTVAELARRMGIDVRRLSEHLLSMGEELGPEDEISPDTAEVVVIDFGQTCSRIDQKYPCVRCRNLCYLPRRLWLLPTWRCEWLTPWCGSGVVSAPRCPKTRLSLPCCRRGPPWSPSWATLITAKRRCLTASATATSPFPRQVASLRTLPPSQVRRQRVSAA